MSDINPYDSPQAASKPTREKQLRNDDLSGVVLAVLLVVAASPILIFVGVALAAWMGVWGTLP